MIARAARWSGAGAARAVAAEHRCREPARRSPSCASATSRSRATRRTTTRSSPPTWCSAGSSSAAINLNLREEKGFTYGARTSFDFRRLAGPFALQVSVQTRGDRGSHPGVDAARSRRFAVRGRSRADELATGVAALTRGYARNFETAEQLARAVTQHGALRPARRLLRTTSSRVVEQITADDITRVARQYLDPARLTTLIVGDYDAVASDLPKLALGVPVILAPTRSELDRGSFPSGVLVIGPEAFEVWRLRRLIG